MKYFLLLLSFSIVACTNSGSKTETSKFLKEKIKSHKHGKSRGFFEVAIQDSHVADGLQLTAAISTRQNFENTTIEWKLPEHLNLISGELKGTESFKAGEQKTSEITLSTDGLKDGDQIFLFVYKMMNGERHGSSQSFVYNSDFKKSQTQPATNNKSKKPKKIIQ